MTVASYTHDLAMAELARHMPEDVRGRTLGACGDFGCFVLAGVL